MTEDRPGFLSWLLWNYDKQVLRACELVIVDSSRNPPAVPPRADVRVLRCAPGTSVARKRNLAVEAARGAAITWFDDDDWQHPRKTAVLADALAAGAVLAGARRSWFVELATGRSSPYERPAGILFNACGIRRDALAEIRFDERRERAADTPWLKAVAAQAAHGSAVLDETLSLWLCHRRNLSNPARRRVFTHPLDSVRETVGRRAWGDTDAQLAALRARVGSA